MLCSSEKVLKSSEQKACLDVAAFESKKKSSSNQAC